MNEAELRQASSELGHELRLWAGVGVARLRQRWDTNATGGYRFESYKPPFEYDNSTPGPALNLGAACWFSPNWGAQASSRLVVAYKGLEFSDPAYTSDPVRLTLATYSLDLAGQLRFPFLRPGAFFHGRFGYRYFQLDWDQAQPDPQEIKGAQSPLYWSTIYQGPFLGLGMRYPFAGWIGVEGSADVVPYAFARNTVVGGTTQTPSGDVTRAWGFTGEVQVWLLISQGPPTISAEVRFFYDYYWSHFVVPEGADAPRASAPYRAYSDATGDEQAGGCAVAMSIRF
ncbi:MAG: hypothetical protein FJ125_13640 [Deltaproteobacteria bacterium]|nr:hypothetical protein [Deltaproteobacteria bacterium]